MEACLRYHLIDINELVNDLCTCRYVDVNNVSSVLNSTSSTLLIMLSGYFIGQTLKNSPTWRIGDIRKSAIMTFYHLPIIRKLIGTARQRRQLKRSMFKEEQQTQNITHDNDKNKATQTVEKATTDTREEQKNINTDTNNCGEQEDNTSVHSTEFVETDNKERTNKEQPAVWFSLWS